MDQEEREQMNEAAVVDGPGCHPSYTEMLTAIDNGEDAGECTEQKHFIARVWGLPIERIEADIERLDA